MSSQVLHEADPHFGGLGMFSCTRCGAFGEATPTHCPGRQMDAECKNAVEAGRLDFRDGVWVSEASSHTQKRPFPVWVRCPKCRQMIDRGQL